MSGQINYSFEKLLPSTMQGVERWRDFVSSYQDIFQQFFDEQVEPLQNQDNYDLLTISGCVNISDYLGYTISNYDGYTNTLEYFKRQVLTIEKRIKNKTNRTAYTWTRFIYYMSGEVYPMIFDGNYLEPLTNWWSSNESPEAITTLDYDMPNVSYYVPLYSNNPSIQIDAGIIFDTLLPVYGPQSSTLFINPTLDSQDVLYLDSASLIDSLARKVLIDYRMLLCENTTDFLSLNTMKAFYNDTQKIKRFTEQIIYEPILPINYKTDHSITTTNYYGIQDKTTIHGSQTTLLIGTTLGTAFSQVQFGNGKHTTLSSGITGVSSLVLTLGQNDINVVSDGFLNIKRKLTASGTMPNFTEIAVFDASSGCVLYSTFPAINYHSTMISGIDLQLTAV